MDYNTPPPYSPEAANLPQKQGMGCFLKGCLTLIVILVLLGGIGGFFAYRMYRSLADYLADQPVAIQVYPATEEQYQAVEQKIQPFALAFDKNQQATLELSADEINTLIARDPNFAYWRGKMFTSIDGSDLGADVSIPLADEKHANASGQKYFNGHIVTGVGLVDGEVSFTPRTVEINHKPLPSWVMQLFSNKDARRGFNDNLYKDEKTRAFLRRLQAVRVADGKLVIVSAGEAVAPAPQ